MPPRHLRLIDHAVRCPRFDGVTDEELAEVLREAVAERERILDEVGDCPDPATPENVFHPMERSRTAVMEPWMTFASRAMADLPEERMDVQTELWRVGAEHGYKVVLHEGVLRRLFELRDRAEAGEIELDPQDAWVLHLMITARTERGALLDEATKAEVSERNTRIVDLETQYQQRGQQARAAAAVHVTDAARLAGLTQAEVDRCAAAAAERGLPGYVVELENTTEQPFLDRLHDRSLREELFRASVTRGEQPEHDNRPTVVELARLRAEQAAALGFPSPAVMEVRQTGARDVETIAALLTTVGQAAMRVATAEAAELAARFAELEPGATFEPWDWPYVAAILRSERCTLDEERLAPYLELDTVLREGVFAAAGMCYGLTFHELPDVAGYTPDTRVFEVREEDGTPLGIVFLDPYSADTKQGGAWMTAVVEPSQLLGDRAVATMNLSVARPAPGAPCLLRWGQVQTMFHEFGHVLHALLSDVRYPSVAGTNVPQDVMEIPSQVNEVWARHPAILSRFARHHLTGEPMPAEWLDSIDEMEHFGQGRHRLATVSSMLLDQAWHDGRPLPERPEDVDAFEEQALRDAGLWFPLAPPRYRSTYFLHCFGGGYTAGYYGYLWAEVFAADCIAWLEAQPEDIRTTCERLRRGFLGRGGSCDTIEAYRDLTGREPDPQHLLERHGLA